MSNLELILINNRKTTRRPKKGESFCKLFVTNNLSLLSYKYIYIYIKKKKTLVKLSIVLKV